MLRIGTTSKLSSEGVIKKAVQYFGPEGLGLKVTEQSASSVALEGGGGGVGVSVCPEGTGTSVDIVSREWDDQVKAFTQELSR